MKDSAVELANKIREVPVGGAPIPTKLRTDQQVLARVTDGIYRQPSSAIRELISNAFDADAASVVIQTDAPRFSEIRIRDDGNGFSIDSLASLVHHIGGSPKRSAEGVGLGVTRADDPTRSPGGRKLIGKAGIGLFAVAQLTRRFQVITKKKGDAFRIIADVILHAHAEEGASVARRADYETGDVQIWRVPATDVDSQGTEIILKDLLPKIKENLRTEAAWARDDFKKIEDPESSGSLPQFHIGRVNPKNLDEIIAEPRLPWEKADGPKERFRKLVESITGVVENTERNPTIERSFDNYLRMIWTLSLSAPLPYLEENPFDVTAREDLRIFQLRNDRGEQAEEIQLEPGETPRMKLGIAATENAGPRGFIVQIDDIQLSRPLRFRQAFPIESGLSGTLLFVGSYSPDLSRYPKEFRGGALAFDAYIHWAPKVVPKEHIGSLIRIHDASGSLFDETFMKYQVAELTRLKQISCEIFIRTGMDAALNIDREGFNFAHPHYQLVQEWLHQAIRQFANKHKALVKEERARKKSHSEKEDNASLDKILAGAISDAQKLDVGPGEVSPVKFVEKYDGGADRARKGGAIVFNVGTDGQYKEILSELKALIGILDAFEMIEDLNYKQQQKLFSALANVLLATKIK